ACRVVPEADLTVTLPSAVRAPEAGDSLAKGGAIDLPGAGRPIIVRDRLDIEAASIDDQRSLARRIRETSGIPGLTVPPATLHEIASRAASGVSVEVTIDRGVREVLELRLADELDDPVTVPVIAFDIGTTTVAGYLVDLATHTVLASRSAPNDQEAYGADVISRIASFERGAPLGRAIGDQLGRMTRQLAADAGVREDAVTGGSIVGNTTMIHLVLGLDPGAISRAPFVPVVLESLTLRAREVGLPIHPRSRVRIPPGVSAYVGPDIVADLLATGMHDAEGISLLVDIGTNGEMVCGGRDGLVACSTAAGPAFEGATIRHGSGGISGAINHVRREDGRIVVETIGNAPAVSICGTGLMDAVAMLLDDGVVDETGRVSLEHAEPAIRERYVSLMTKVDGEPALVLSSAPGSAGSEPQARPIVLTQSDIRQVQLAKGAIAAGVRVLLEELGARAEDLQAVYLAGGFGTYVRPSAAVRVGLLPGIDADRVTAVGNAAGAGAARLLVDETSVQEAERVVERCRYLELSGSPSFQMYYMDEMLFPGA
ncbi:MAG: ASKHA domain-containing protein, partial [Spirochaetota bacterium]